MFLLPDERVGQTSKHIVRAEWEMIRGFQAAEGVWKGRQITLPAGVGNKTFQAKETMYKRQVIIKGQTTVCCCAGCAPHNSACVRVHVSVSSVGVPVRTGPVQITEREKEKLEDRTHLMEMRILARGYDGN